MIVTITHPAAGQDMEPFQRRPAIGVMETLNPQWLPRGFFDFLHFVRE